MGDSLGIQIRRARRRRGWTLDELAKKTRISKPYLSLIENQRVHNPSDEKLRRLESVLGFAAGELLHQAHLRRTPADIRAMLTTLAKGAAQHGWGGAASAGTGMNLDAAYLSGVLQQVVESAGSNTESIGLSSVPVINRVSAGYPADFTDLSYPRGVADDYIACPELADPDAFAARVNGDSMAPKYAENDVVIFSPAVAPRSGDDCFVRLEDAQTTFKRVYFETNADGEEVVRLQPRNEAYAARIVPRAGISGIYRAMYRYEVVDGD